MIVVVRIEQIVFPVVLVVDHSLNATQAGFEQAMRGFALCSGSIGVTTPGKVGPCQIIRCLLPALVDQCLQSSSIGARFGPKYPCGSSAFG